MNAAHVRLPAVALPFYAAAERIVRTGGIDHALSGTFFDRIDQECVAAVVAELWVAAWIPTNHTICICCTGRALLWGFSNTEVIDGEHVLSACRRKQ